MKIAAFAQSGYEGSLVRVHAEIRDGIPAVDIAGLAEGSVRESAARMKVAAGALGLDFPDAQVILSLLPESVYKNGSIYDLPMALAVLSEAAKKRGEETPDECILAVGALCPDGKTGPVSGVFAAVQSARDAGVKYAVVPAACRQEAKKCAGIKIFAAGSLASAYRACLNLSLFEDSSEAPADADDSAFGSMNEYIFDASVRVAEALTAAVAGRLSIVIAGQDEDEMNRIADVSRFLQSYPAQAQAERVMRMRSLAGLAPEDAGAVRSPYVCLSPKVSIQQLFGGGTGLLPGELSLADGGILRLCNLHEFPVSVLQGITIASKERKIEISRAGRTSVYPASFSAVATLKDAPDGYSAAQKDAYYYSVREFVCNGAHIALRLEQEGSAQFSASALRKKIGCAMERQYQRQGKLNGELTAEEASAENLAFENDVKELYSKSVSDLKLCGRREYMLAVAARTAADVDGSDSVQMKHMEQAVRLCCSDIFSKEKK